MKRLFLVGIVGLVVGAVNTPALASTRGRAYCAITTGDAENKVCYNQTLDEQGIPIGQGARMDYLQRQSDSYLQQQRSGANTRRWIRNRRAERELNRRGTNTRKRGNGGK